MDFLQMITPTVEAIAIVIDMIGAGLILIGAVKFALRAATLEIQRLHRTTLQEQSRIPHNGSAVIPVSSYPKSTLCGEPIRLISQFAGTVLLRLGRSDTWDGKTLTQRRSQRTRM
jgi:hypothetical protein